MRETNETITVFNQRYDTTTGKDVWTPTVIQGVSWFEATRAAVTQAGLKAADTATVRIPTDADTGGKVYLPPKAYKTAESVSGAFTLAPGDLIVRAAITTTGLTPSQIQAQYDDTITILGVTDSTHRRRAPHWKVTGQ
ncbi:MAG: hypothetical protein J6Y26_02315 [Lachnospiraceae bacterium]|nr:hypothetical protein [Lachnospiraceae bacterium]